MECVLPQFSILNELYYVYFGHFGHVSSCLFWVQMMFSLLMMLVCKSCICNICLLFAVFVWVPYALVYYYCHPLCVAGNLGWIVT